MTHRDKPILYQCEGCGKLLSPPGPDQEPEDCPNCGSRKIVGLVRQWKERKD